METGMSTDKVGSLTQPAASMVASVEKQPLHVGQQHLQAQDAHMMHTAKSVETSTAVIM